jgi:hypothetical protein
MDRGDEPRMVLDSTNAGSAFGLEISGADNFGIMGLFIKNFKKLVYT